MANRFCPARSQPHGSGRPIPTSPATTATSSTSSTVAPRSSTGTADTLSGVAADDEAMTLTVTLDAPYANFDAVSGFQLFFPMPTEATEAADPAAWENGVMVGNGPYKMEEPRTDEEIVIVRNDSWAGDIHGETWPDRLEKITFKVNADPDTSFNGFEAGEGHNANVPPARATEAQENYDTTLDNAVLGSYFYTINQRAPEIGGDENKLLRQAISQAIDRDEINSAVYNDTRTVSTGVTPIGIPGAEEGLCDYCAYDPEAAQEAFDEWTAAGNEQTEPIRIQFNADAGHEPVVQIIVDNLAAIGIEAEAEPFPTETYFTQLAEGACVFCRTGWYADYPTYDNFMYDLFHSDALDGNNYGFINEEFDALVDEAKETIDKDRQGELFREAEQILLNDEIMAIPLNAYRGDYVYDPDASRQLRTEQPRSDPLGAGPAGRVAHHPTVHLADLMANETGPCCSGPVSRRLPP